MLFQLRKSFLPLLYILLCLLALPACQPNNDLDDHIPNVDLELVPHFNQFKKEAQARGFNIDFIATGVSATIGQAHDHKVGLCYPNSKHIVIDANFWNTASHYSRELIVFHELGHCLLGRNHRDDADANHRCNSIMRSGDTSCFDNYTETTRAHYIDELFTIRNED
jgi:hypothetical protein